MMGALTTTVLILRPLHSPAAGLVRRVPAAFAWSALVRTAPGHYGYREHIGIVAAPVEAGS